ncbi:MAG: DUF983 domain-containing protein [Alphaproteobacteria bacterium]
MASPQSYASDAGVMAGVKGCCPRCGEGRLFAGFIDLAPRCEVCGLDYSFADSGDGPAVFIMLIAGAIVVGTALIIDANYEPPLWLLGAIFLPLTVFVSLGLLRPLKGWLIASQYRHKAEQGQLER